METRVVGGLRIFGAPTIAGFRAALAVACFGTTTTEAAFLTLAEGVVGPIAVGGFEQHQ